MAPDLAGRAEAIRFVSRDVSAPVAAKVLATEGVRYAVLHDDVYGSAGEKIPTPARGYFKLLARFGPVRIYSVAAPHVSIARVLSDNATVIGLLQGQVAPSVVAGSGFNQPQFVDGVVREWMIQKGQLVIDNKGDPMRVQVVGTARSTHVSRVLEVRNDEDGVLCRQRIPTSSVPLRCDSFVVGHGTTSLTVLASPGPQPLGGGDLRTASVLLSDLRAAPLPRWTVSSS
jgi:hypothetical protein